MGLIRPVTTGLEFDTDTFQAIAKDYFPIEIAEKWEAYVAEVYDENGDFEGTLVYIPSVPMKNAVRESKD